MSREAIIPDVRKCVQSADRNVQHACKALRENGFPESAADLERISKQLQVWSQPQGMLHWLEQPDFVEPKETVL